MIMLGSHKLNNDAESTNFILHFKKAEDKREEKRVDAPDNLSLGCLRFGGLNMSMWSKAQIMAVQTASSSSSASYATLP
jgi:hypothetical protein